LNRRGPNAFQRGQHALYGIIRVGLSGGDDVMCARAFALVIATISAGAPLVSAQAPVAVFGAVPHDGKPQGATTADQQGAPAAVDRTPPTPHRGEWVIAPMPMINPTLDNGIAVALGYLYRLDSDDHVTPPSLTMAGGFKTSNGSWSSALVQKLHLGKDRVRVLALAAYGDINYDFYGIGHDAGSAGRTIELNQKGPVLLGDVLYRIAPSTYVGARYQLMEMTISAPSPAGGPVLPPLDRDMRTAALGPRLEVDTRDNPFYPRRGLQLEANAGFHGEAVGGTRTYQVYEGWLNGYQAVGAEHVVAWHVGACGVGGPAPFYDLCALGKNQDLRGYPVGQFRDRAMLAAQAEWRTEIWGRLGGAVFAGVGAVAPSLDNVAIDDVLPGAGVGLRITLAKRNHVNLRVDYAWGERSNALYIGVGEAF
jgi:hypothetical protein